MNRLTQNVYDKSCAESYEKSLLLPPLVCTALLPQLRGEWVRKGVGKNRREKNRKEQSKDDRKIQSMTIEQSSSVHGHYAVRDGPVWGINTPKAAPGDELPSGVTAGFSCQTPMIKAHRDA